MTNELWDDKNCDFESTENEVVGFDKEAEMKLLWMTAFSWMWY